MKRFLPLTAGLAAYTVRVAEAAHPSRAELLDANGRRDPRPDALNRWRRTGRPPGITIEKATFAGQAFVVTDNEGETMCTLALGNEDAVADVYGPCR